MKYLCQFLELGILIVRRLQMRKGNFQLLSEVANTPELITDEGRSSPWRLARQALLVLMPHSCSQPRLHI